MSHQVLLDISNASKRSLGQARRFNQPNQTEEERRNRRNELRRQRSSRGLNNIPEVLNEIMVPPAEPNGTGMDVDLPDGTDETITLQHSAEDTVIIDASQQLEAPNGERALRDEDQSHQRKTGEKSIPGSQILGGTGERNVPDDSIQEEDPAKSMCKSYSDLWIHPQASKFDSSGQLTMNGLAWLFEPYPGVYSYVSYMREVYSQCAFLAAPGCDDMKGNDQRFLRAAMLLDMKPEQGRGFDWRDLHRWLFPYSDPQESERILTAYSKSCLQSASTQLRRLFDIGNPYDLALLCDLESRQSNFKMLASASVLMRISPAYDGKTWLRRCFLAKEIRLIKVLFLLQDETTLVNKIGAQKKRWAWFIKQTFSLDHERIQRLDVVSRVNWNRVPVSPPVFSVSPPSGVSQVIRDDQHQNASRISADTASSVFSFGKWLKATSTNGSILEK